jgi:N-acetylglutamate synthase-like GNAT family acetyltransferase
MIRRAGINPLGLHWRRFVVVEARESIIACGQVKVHGDSSRELASLAVAEGWQGTGLARAVIEHLQRQAGPPLWLTCREGLVPLYQRFGFREVTESGELSPYFRRLMRLARFILRIVRPEEGLAVMLWPESCTDREDRPVGAWREG